MGEPPQPCSVWTCAGVACVASPRTQPLTLRQLQAAGVLGDCRVVTGERGLDCVITDVAVVEQCDMTTPMSPGLLSS